jgi:DNA-binding winged helix-turn-helix (wHTH) protein
VSTPTPPASRKSGIARFGVFEADVANCELRKQGRRVRLQDQPFAVLSILLQRAGTVVTREELRSRLWPADTFVDFDHSLNTAINKLREVLGDSAASPRFVETLARRGYRFVAGVQWDSETLDNPQLRVAQHPELEIPMPHRGLTRSLFALLQVMYLVFYLEALIHWRGVDAIATAGTGTPWTLVLVLVTAAVGIPVRFYLLSAVFFDYARLADKFHKIFLPLLALDELWAGAPFLLINHIGFGAALAATAALLYVPFAERTLIRMAYPPTTHHRDTESQRNP